MEESTRNLLSSQEVHDIAVALGVDPGSDDLKGLRYGKVCILADAGWKYLSADFWNAEDVESSMEATTWW